MTGLAHRILQDGEGWGWSTVRIIERGQCIYYNRTKQKVIQRIPVFPPLPLVSPQYGNPIFGVIIALFLHCWFQPKTCRLSAVAGCVNEQCVITLCELVLIVVIFVHFSRARFSGLRDGYYQLLCECVCVCDQQAPGFRFLCSCKFVIIFYLVQYLCFYLFQLAICVWLRVF